jgi:Tol biopolymer transport system component
MFRKFPAQAISIGQMHGAFTPPRILRSVVGAVTVLLASSLDAIAATKLTTDDLSTISGYQLSSNGQRIVFSTYTHPEGERYYTRPLLGGHLPVLLYDSGTGRSGDFLISPDNQWVVIGDYRRAGIDEHRVFTRRIDGTGPLNDLTANLTFPNYDFSARVFIVPETNELVVRTRQNDGLQQMYTGPIDGSTAWSPIVDLPTNTLQVLLSGSEERAIYRKLGVYSVPTDASTLPVDLTGGLDVGDLSITPDGRRAIFRGGTTWYSAPVDASAPLVALGTAAYVHNLGTESLPTPDSSRFVFLSDAAIPKQYELYSRAIDASLPPEKLSLPLTLGGDVANFTISPDSQWVAFSETDSMGIERKRFLARSDGTGDPIELELPAPDGYTVKGVSFTPDSRKLLYTASRTDSVQETHIWSRTYFQLLSYPIDGSAPPVLLSTNVGPKQSVAEVFTTPDGKYVLFGKSSTGLGHGINVYELPTNQALFVVPANGGTPQLVNDPQSDEFIYRVQVTHDGRHVVYVDSDASDLFLAEIPEPSPLLPIPGDYDSNGTVDSSDYIIWRATLGQSGVVLAADGNLNGEVDAGDYDVWRAHFGRSHVLTEPFENLATVPEPAANLLLICALLCLQVPRSPRRVAA